MKTKLKLMLETLKESYLCKSDFYFYSTDKDIYFTGLCGLVRCLFSGNELEEVEDYLNMNKPDDIDSLYWFTRAHVDFDDAKQERIDFLDKLINEL